MKKLKQMIGFILLTFVFVNSFAYAKPSQTQLAAEELQALSILVGDETGALLLEQNVTRAQLAAIVCRLMGLEQTAKENACLNNLCSDVPLGHWATGYIQVVTESDIMDVDTKQCFYPEQEVSNAEVIKILITMLGYLPKAEVMGGYPHGVLMVANQLGLSEGLSLSTEEPAIRENVAVLVQNCLDIPLMKQSGFGADSQYQIMEDVTLRTQYFFDKK